MSTVTISRLTDSVGAEVTGIDPERFQTDDSLPGLVLDALAENGVLVFPKLGLDHATQVTFAARLGNVEYAKGSMDPADAVSRVSMDRTYALSRTLKGAFNWHMDGCTLPEGRNPGSVTILTCIGLADEGGQTEFASTYKAYDAYSAAEKERLDNVRVVHTVAATQRRLYDFKTTPEQEAEWAGGPRREHPLVWKHQSGRRSMVMGATAESVVGMSPADSRAFLDDLLAQATGPGRVYRHEWSLGDLLMWDNRGILHRVEPYVDDSPREMIRTCLIGDEPIQ